VNLNENMMNITLRRVRHGNGEANLGLYRAKPCPNHALDDDPSTMVQEQLARLKFFFAATNLQSHRFLDLGCGTGFNCHYVRTRYGAERTLGVDISPEAIHFAREHYSDADFSIGDVTDRTLDMGACRWDAVLCCEVIEHVQRPHDLLHVVKEHLAANGRALITTPNRDVFSLGHEPSPVNATHVKEFNLREFHELLGAHFDRVEIWGQRFRSADLLRSRQAALRRSISDYHLLGRYFWHTGVRHTWKFMRLEPLHRLLEGPLRWSWTDFEFVPAEYNDCIWHCAVIT